MIRSLLDVIWSPKQRKNYKIVKLVSILFGTLTIPLDVYTGFLLGTERYEVAFPIIGAMTVFAIADAYAWAWVLEQMAKDKVRYGKHARK